MYIYTHTHTYILYMYIYIYIPLHSCDYLKKSSTKTNVATDEENSRNEQTELNEL